MSGGEPVRRERRNGGRRAKASGAGARPRVEESAEGVADGGRVADGELVADGGRPVGGAGGQAGKLEEQRAAMEGLRQQAEMLRWQADSLREESEALRRVIELRREESEARRRLLTAVGDAAVREVEGGKPGPEAEGKRERRVTPRKSRGGNSDVARVGRKKGGGRPSGDADSPTRVVPGQARSGRLATETAEVVAGPAELAKSGLPELIAHGQSAYSGGDLLAAVRYWDAALRNAEGAPGEGEMRTTLRENLAALHQALGNTKEAREYYRSALAEVEAVYGVCSAESAAVLNHFAELERCDGNRVEAEGMFRRALAMVEEVDAPAQTLLTVMANTAQCLSETGNTEEAAALYHRAILAAQGRAAVAPGSVGVLWNNAAGLAVVEERWEDALGGYRQAVLLLAQGGEGFAGQRRQAMRNYAATLRRYAQVVERLAGG